jgi:hypothetical protein
MTEVKQASIWRIIGCDYLKRDGDKLPSLSMTLKANAKVWTLVLVGDSEFGLQEWNDALRAASAFTAAACGMPLPAGIDIPEADDMPPLGSKPS